MLPKNLYTVVTKVAGEKIETDYLKLIFDKKPNVFGYAVQDGEGLSIGREEGTPDFDALEQMNEETKDMRSMLCFGWLDKGFNIEDIQPFTINDADDKPFLAIGLDGDFPKYDTNNGRTQEFNLMAEIIAPSLADICELTDGDIAKLMATIGKPMFNNNFLAAVGHRGVLNILPFEGDSFYAGKDVLGGEPFTWGRTSNLHGWGEEKVQEVKTEVKKPRFTFAGKKPAAPPALPQDVATKGEGPKTSVPEVKTVGATTVKDVKKEAPKAGPAPIRPPDWVHKNDDKRTWYQMVGGAIPNGFKKGIPVIPVEGAVIPKNIEDLNAWRAARAKSTIVAAGEQKAPVTATSAGAPKSGVEVKEIRQQENAPIIPAASMDKILDLVTKHLDGQSVEMKDPKTIQAAEQKFVEFSAAIASSPQEIVNWPISFLFAMAKTDIAALVAYAVEMRSIARARMEEKGLMAKPEPAKATTTTTKIGDNSTKTESISNEPAPKKKGFSFGKKAA